MKVVILICLLAVVVNGDDDFGDNFGDDDFGDDDFGARRVNFGNVRNVGVHRSYYRPRYHGGYRRHPRPVGYHGGLGGGVSAVKAAGTPVNVYTQRAYLRPNYRRLGYLRRGLGHRGASFYGRYAGPGYLGGPFGHVGGFTGLGSYYGNYRGIGNYYGGYSNLGGGLYGNYGRFGARFGGFRFGGIEFDDDNDLFD